MGYAICIREKVIFFHKQDKMSSRTLFLSAPIPPPSPKKFPLVPLVRIQKTREKTEQISRIFANCLDDLIWNIFFQHKVLQHTKSNTLTSRKDHFTSQHINFQVLPTLSAIRRIESIRSCNLEKSLWNFLDKTEKLLFFQPKLDIIGWSWEILTFLIHRLSAPAIVLRHIFTLVYNKPPFFASLTIFEVKLLFST